jgi:glucose/arabinose dehydrogenase
LITEKSGEMYLFTENSGLNVIEGLPEVKVQGQGGLMDVKVHPDYQNNGWIYFTYASADGGGSGANTCLMRAKLQDGKLVSKEVLYKGDPNTRSGNHFGSRIEFDRDGFVYFTIGDRGDRDLNPQDYYRDNGKVYRLKDDGTIPESNPFFSQSGAKKAIYSYGHRNPQGMAIHPETGEIWTHEHGPQGGDEINIIEAGKNYGWPVISYGINYDGSKFTDITEKDGMEQPLWYWVPSIAPSGMAFSSSEKYNSWKGDLFVGSLKFQYLMHCKIENNKVVSEEPLFKGIGRVRAVEEGPDGLIYFSVEGKGIYRMKSFNP